MNRKQIETILHSPKMQQSARHWKLVETHISFVLLGNSVAFKFKKEIKYSFLDFSTLEKRKYFCERELELNNRLSKGVYLKIVPVYRFNNDLVIDGKNGQIIDYALQMKRLQESKQMNLMLDNKEVTKKHMKVLADLIRSFHQRTAVIKTKFNIQHFASRFNDIRSVSAFIKTALGPAAAKIISDAVKISDHFLKTHYDLFSNRVQEGFIRDCHGDLHSRNVFLYHKPIVFDCLEFNDEFRQIDILDELAFFCMDLEDEEFYQLSKAFTDYYFSGSKNEFGKKEKLLFTYYKCYRANVRAKVNALRAMQAKDEMLTTNLEEVKKYLVLMSKYLGKIDR
jgi:aminoglycoside phosphotransferase family enzyme